MLFCKRNVLNSVCGGTALGLLLLGGALAQPARADASASDATAEASADDVGIGDAGIEKIETVVVTAMKRGNQTAQTVPTSMGVIGEDDLKQLNVTQFSDFAGFVAGLNYADNGPGDKRYILRGMNSSGDSQTAVYYDNIPTTGLGSSASDYGSAQPDLDLYDVEQIEVLRGPQGTLYGSNSQSGVIHFVTNKPDVSDFAADLLIDTSTTHDGGDNYSVHGMLNIPLLKDRLAVRVVAYHTYDDGFIDNPLRGEENVNYSRQDGVRAALKWNIDDNTSLTLQYFYQDLHTGGRPLERLYDYTIADNEYDADGSRKMSLHSDESRMDRSNIYALTFEHSFSWADFTFATSDFKRDFRRVEDYTYSFDYFRYLQDTVDYAEGETIPSSGVMVAPQSSDLWSNEARISTKFDSAVNGVFGIYYSYRAIKFENHIYGTDEVSGEPDYDDEVSSRKFRDRTGDFAVFGEITYDITDALSVTGGARYYDTVRHLNPKTLVYLFNQEDDDEDVASHSKNRGAIYKGLVNYKITNKIMVYAEYAQGFRGGGANTAASSYVPSQYGPDKTADYEVGAKTQWWDDKILLNVSLYHILLKDMQVSEYFGPGGAFNGVGNISGSAARSNGVEGDLIVKPYPGLTLQSSGSYTNAKLTKTISDLGDLAVKGTPLLSVPKVNFSFRAQYAFAITNDISATVSGNMTYKGKVEYYTYDEYNEPTPAYTLANFSATMNWDSYALSLYINNAFDKNAQLSVMSDVNDPYTVVTNQPRTIGLRFGAHW